MERLPQTRIKISNRSEPKDNLAEVCSCQIVIPAVPISEMLSILKQINPLLGKDSTVMDVCSVKVMPVKWMKQELKKGTPIIASHPVFGPDSTRSGKELKGTNLMISNISAKTELYDSIKDFWRECGVNVVEITPEEHDHFSAYTINYNHLIGRIGELVGIKPTPVDTKGFKVIYEALQYVTNDSWQLFYDMQNFNPYAREMRKKVAAAVAEIERRLEN